MAGRDEDRSALYATIRRQLRAAFTERLAYKGAALFFAIVLWLVVSAEELLLRVPLVRSDWIHEPERNLWHTPMELYLPKHRRGTKLQLETPTGSIARADLGGVRDGAPLQGFALYQRALRRWLDGPRSRQLADLIDDEFTRLTCMVGRR